MDEFDMSNLDSFDFETVAKSAKENSDKKAAEEAENIAELREGAGDCLGGSCTIGPTVFLRLVCLGMLQPN